MTTATVAEPFTGRVTHLVRIVFTGGAVVEFGYLSRESADAWLNVVRHAMTGPSRAIEMFGNVGIPTTYVQSSTIATVQIVKAVP